MKKINSVAMSEIWRQNVDGYLPVLFDIYNPDLTWADGTDEQDDMHLRLINDSSSVTYQGKRYIPCAFDFQPPEEDGSKMGDATITVSGIDDRIVQLLRGCRLVSEVTIVAAFMKEQDGEDEFFTFIPLSNYTFKMSGATYTRTAVTLSLTNDDIFSLNTPRDLAIKDMLPSVNENAG